MVIFIIPIINNTSIKCLKVIIRTIMFLISPPSLEIFRMFSLQTVSPQSKNKSNKQWLNRAVSAETLPPLADDGSAYFSQCQCEVSVEWLCERAMWIIGAMISRDNTGLYNVYAGPGVCSDHLVPDTVVFPQIWSPNSEHSGDANSEYAREAPMVDAADCEFVARRAVNAIMTIVHVNNNALKLKYIEKMNIMWVPYTCCERLWLYYTCIEKVFFCYEGNEVFINQCRVEWCYGRLG